MSDKPTLNVIGLISGTSADGIDAALAEIRGGGMGVEARLKAFKCYPYPGRMIDAVFNAFRPGKMDVDELCALNFVLGELFAAAAVDLARETGLDMSEVDLIGSHGQTIWHSPEQKEVGGMWTISTLQMAEPAVIAERTGATVVADFRPADMAAGGQGAPLIPYADYVLFRSPSRNRAVQNIGGIGNVTYIPAEGDMENVVAFDTGPGNVLIDGIVMRATKGKQRYDVNGKLALAGKVEPQIMDYLMRHPFLHKRPPKATGREDFGLQLADHLLERWPEVSLEDMTATVTAFTAESIRWSYERWLPSMPDDVIIGGGGGRNPALMSMLVEALPRTKLYTHEDFGMNSDAKEALAFALLAVETLNGRPTNVPAVTGARNPAVLGKITPGRNYRSLMKMVCSTGE